MARKEKEKASVATKLSLPYKLLNCSRKVEGTRSKRIKRAFPFSYPLVTVWKKGKKGEESKSGRTKRSGRTNRLFCPMFFPLISRRNWTLENRCIFHWPRDARPGSIEPGKRARVLVTSFSPSRHSRVRPG